MHIIDVIDMTVQTCNVTTIRAHKALLTCCSAWLPPSPIDAPNWLPLDCSNASFGPFPAFRRRASAATSILPNCCVVVVPPLMCDDRSVAFDWRRPPFPRFLPPPPPRDPESSIRHACRKVFRLCSVSFDAGLTVAMTTVCAMGSENDDLSAIVSLLERYWWLRFFPLARAWMQDFKAISDELISAPSFRRLAVWCMLSMRCSLPAKSTNVSTPSVLLSSSWM